MLGQGRAVIGQRPFVDDPARGGEHTDVMAAVAKTRPRVQPPGAAGAGVEVETTDGVVLVVFFIGREDNPATGTGPLPSHSIWLGGKMSLIIIDEIFDNVCLTLANITVQLLRSTNRCRNHAQK
jgi:hypothetical protein